jgi:hypothetical protein
VEGALAEEPSRSPVSASWHEGATGFAEAKREQERSGAPMLVYFRTDWCPYCQQLERELLVDNRVERFLRYEVVKVRINPEDGPAEKALADEFGNTGYPAVYLTPTLRLSPRQVSLGGRAGGDKFAFCTPTELVERIQEPSLRAVRELVREGFDKRSGGDVLGSLAVLTDALALDPKNAEAYFQRALSRLADGAPDLAYAELRTALFLGFDLEEVFKVGGQDLLRRELYDQGVACWTAYLDRSGSGKTWGHIWRSQMHYRRGDRARAREDAEASCRLGEPKGCELVAQLGAPG